MRHWWLGLVLLGCGTPTEDALVRESDSESWVDFQGAAVAVGVESRFLGRATWVPTAEQEAEIRARCPTLTRGKLTKETESVWLAQLQGERLAEVEQVGALLDNDKLAVVASELDGGVLRFPVACESCRIVLGVDLGDDRIAACTGAGFSLTVADGVLQSP